MMLVMCTTCFTSTHSSDGLFLNLYYRDKRIDTPPINPSPFQFCYVIPITQSPTLHCHSTYKSPPYAPALFFLTKNQQQQQQSVYQHYHWQFDTRVPKHLSTRKHTDSNTKPIYQNCYENARIPKIQITKQYKNSTPQKTTMYPNGRSTYPYSSRYSMQNPHHAYNVMPDRTYSHQMGGNGGGLQYNRLFRNRDHSWSHPSIGRYGGAAPYHIPSREEILQWRR